MFLVFGLLNIVQCTVVVVKYVVKRLEPEERRYRNVQISFFKEVAQSIFRSTVEGLLQICLALLSIMFVIMIVMVVVAIFACRVLSIHAPSTASW